MAGSYGGAGDPSQRQRLGGATRDALEDDADAMAGWEPYEHDSSLLNNVADYSVSNEVCPTKAREIMDLESFMDGI